MAFHDLPVETLVDIGSRLNTSSLLSLGLVNKACRAAAVPSIYSNIVLYVGNPHTLPKDAAAFKRTWEELDIFRHVRSLHIRGFSLPRETDVNAMGGSAYRRNEWRSGPDLQHMFKLGWFPYIDFTQSGWYYDVDFQPLADTISRFAGLEQLIFDTGQQFPPCLLELVQSSLPNCKLEIRCFFIESVYNDVVNPHEYNVVTSPNLTSVHTWYTYFQGDGGYDDGDLNDLATLDMVSGLAPALKEVRLYHDMDVLQAFWESKHERLSAAEPPLPALDPPRSWHGFSREAARHQGSLETLELSCDFDGKGLVTADCLARWAEATDFSCLRRLHLDYVDESAVQWLRTVPSLKNLTALRLGSHILLASPFKQLSGLLARLPPLRELSIDGEFDGQHLDSLLLQQGDRAPLHELKITSSDHTFDRGQITQLLKRCPNVESLNIHTQRTQGDRTEYELYNTLGKFPCLHTLVLSLDCKTIDEPGPRPGDPFYGLNDLDKRRRSRLLPIEPSFGRYESQRCPIPDDYGFQPLRNGHVMTRLTNGAIDESLATSIWEAITSAKPSSSTPLHSLRLLPHKDRYFHAFDEVEEVIERVQLQWTLERSANTVILKSELDCLFAVHEGERLYQPLTAVMEELWPGIFDEGKDWTTSWRSQSLWNPEGGVV
ncbi:hypothetical protein PRZ48_012732 [Zasmidium cellare]|uniref:F-box domain-containing protein n=1 Tax=Zasmidium cellare TaxID=395010 RepID=A0ABR0E5Q7_ZASCE|nr:hypothetical protein PRZ48_012732 [Zasmidium cellare]